MNASGTEDFALKLKEAYNAFYDNGMWQDMGGGSKSGIGSSLKYSKSFANNLIEIIDRYKIQNIFDCSCGDWFWMEHIKDRFEHYQGNDICQKIVNQNKEKYGNSRIRFSWNDMLSEMRLQGDLAFDLIICRHTLEHLPEEYNLASILEMKRVAKYAIVTSANLPYSINEKSSIVFGDHFRPPYKSINLDLPPYDQVLPSPIEKFWDSVENQQSSVGTFGYLYQFN